MGQLEKAIPGILADHFSYGGKFDLDEWLEEVHEAAAEHAEQVCIYNADQVDIIDDYEGHEYADSPADIDGQTGAIYSPSEWESARAAYAAALAYSVLTGLLNDAVDDVKQAADDLLEYAKSEGAPDTLDYSDLDVDGYSCPFGLLPHTKEVSYPNRGAYGDTYILAWLHQQLDGLNGVACEVHGVWLAVCWEPSKEKQQ